jgi:hypothetical protein
MNTKKINSKQKNENQFIYKKKMIGVELKKFVILWIIQGLKNSKG